MGRLSLGLVLIAACSSSSAPTKGPVLTNSTTSSTDQARNDVVKETLAALAAGDVDRLMALADPKGLYEYAFSCKSDRGDDDLGADSKQLEASLRKDLTKATSGT